MVNFNRSMLPTYYGLLRLCCAANTSFCRTLASHQNIQWAFKNIAPYSTQVPLENEDYNIICYNNVIMI